MTEHSEVIHSQESTTIMEDMHGNKVVAEYCLKVVSPYKNIPRLSNGVLGAWIVRPGGSLVRAKHEPYNTSVPVRTAEIEPSVEDMVNFLLGDRTFLPIRFTDEKLELAYIDSTGFTLKLTNHK